MLAVSLSMMKGFVVRDVLAVALAWMHESMKTGGNIAKAPLHISEGSKRSIWDVW
jgi:hypothetical protein